MVRRKGTKHPDNQRQRPFSIRAYVGGVLYIEGIVCLLLGLVLLIGYWPPVSNGSVPSNPISLVGLWICGCSLVYMFIVGLGFFIYSLVKPTPPEFVSPLARRAERYRMLENNQIYLFDEELTEEADAEEAWLARQLY